MARFVGLDIGTSSTKGLSMTPDPALQARYAEQLDTFRELHPALHPDRPTSTRSWTTSMSG